MQPTKLIITILFIFLSSLCFAQDAHISGNSNVQPGAIEQYTVQWDINPNPYSNIYFNVTGGTIISQNINPTLQVSCTIQWDNNPGSGSIDVYEDMRGQEGYLSVTIGQSQPSCQPADAGPDQTICGGSVVIGTPAIPGYSYSWSPASGLDNPYIAQPTASPSQTTTYTLTAGGTNLLQNGDFEQGLTGFGTEYGIYPNSNCSSPYSPGTGTVAVNTSPALVSSNYCNKPDHTTGSGNMLVIDGYCSSNQRLWYEPVNIVPNTTYYFSGWMSSNTDNLASLRVRINGIDILQNFTVPIDCNTWTSFTSSWYSGAANTALIEIYDDNTNAYGNDFSLDDLFFGNCPQSTDQVIVNTNTPVVVTPGGPIEVYAVYDGVYHKLLSSNSTTGNQWYKNGVAVQGETNQTYNIQLSGYVTTNDIYSVKIGDCFSNPVTLYYKGCAYLSEYPVPLPSLACGSASPRILNSQQIDLGPGTTYSWIVGYTSSCGTLINYNPSSNICQIDLTNCIQYYNDYAGLEYDMKAQNGSREVYIYPPGVGVNWNCRIGNMDTNKFIIYPNPAISQTTISANYIIESVVISDMFNPILLKKNGNGTKTLNVNISSLKSGVYNCKVTTKQGVIVQKLIIKK